MKLLAALVGCALSLPALASEPPNQPLPGTKVTINGDEALALMKSLTDSGVATDNGTAGTLATTVEAIACNVSLASTKVASCNIRQSNHDISAKDTSSAVLFALFTTHSAVHTNSDGTLEAVAKSIACTQPVPANGTGSCTLIFETAAN